MWLMKFLVHCLRNFKWIFSVWLMKFLVVYAVFCAWRASGGGEL